ncbi:MAG: hypothetical protein U0Z44_11115 [Kouleothrix sp.]
MLGDTINYVIGAKFGTRLFDYNITTQERAPRPHRKSSTKIRRRKTIIWRFCADRPHIRTIRGRRRPARTTNRFITFNIVGGVI